MNKAERQAHNDELESLGITASELENASYTLPESRYQVQVREGSITRGPVVQTCGHWHRSWEGAAVCREQKAEMAEEGYTVWLNACIYPAPEE